MQTALSLLENEQPPTKARRAGQMRLWTTHNYHHAVESGVFGPEERLELIEGKLLQKVGENPPHVVAIELARTELVRAFVNVDCHLRMQHPLSIPPRSEPEPDLCVVRGGIRDYAIRHPAPADVLLLIEVSQATLAFDRRRKAPMYARANIADYWILNLEGRCVEVYRDPQNEMYQSVVTYAENETITPLAAPQAVFRIADLLP